MEAHDQVEFRTMFPDSWEKLQRRGSQIHHIEPGQEGFHVTVGWVKSRLVSNLLKRFRRRKQKDEDSIRWHLFNAYVQQFSKKQKSPTSTSTSLELKSRRIQWMPGEKIHQRPDSDLNNRQNYHVATAMQLAGIVKIKEQSHGDQLQPTGHPIGVEAITVLDRCVNSSPARLAYEYIAAGQCKKLPSRFITLLLTPYLAEQLIAGTSIDQQEATSIIEGLLKQHGIEHPSDLTLENLMEVKNAIRRMGHEHRRLVCAICGQRYIQRGPQHAVSQTPILVRPQIRAVQPERLLADAGATIDSARDHFIEQLRCAGLPPKSAHQKVDKLFQDQNMWGEADFTLTRFIALADEVAGIAAAARKVKGRNPATFRSYESEVSVIEYFSRLKYQNTYRSDHLPSRHLSPSHPPINSVKTSWALQKNSEGKWVPQGRPALEPPDCDPDILCDSDDEWLIKQQVENGHFIRLAKDYGMRMVRWCGRNKRGIGVRVGLIALMGAVYGVQTGGISVAIMLVTYVLTTSAWIAIDTVSDRIHRIRITSRLQKADSARTGRKQGEEPGKEVEDYLDSYSWLTKQHGLSNILNSFKNLQNEVNRLKKVGGINDAAGMIQLRRAQCLAQLRSQQLGDSFGSLDSLIVESVQEVSRLDNHYLENFAQLWEPLEQLDSRTLTRVFNDAANGPGIKQHWYLPKQDYTGWVRQTLTHKTTEADRIALFVEEKLQLDQKLSKQELELEKVSESVNKHVGRGAKIVKEGIETGTSYVKATLRSTLWRYIESGLTKATLGTNPSIAGLAPVPTAAGLLFWAYYYSVGKLTDRINKSQNQAALARYRNAHNDDRFDVGFQSKADPKKAKAARKDFNDDLLSIRREAKASTQEFIDTIKALRKEKQRIDEELRKQLNHQNKLTHEQLVDRASLILKHKMLEQKVYKLMNGALGNMHNETIKAASWLQESAGIYTQ